LPLFKSALPLAIIDLAVDPAVDSRAMWFIILELALVLVAVGVAFHASSIPVVVEPLAFVKTPCLVDTDA